MNKAELLSSNAYVRIKVAALAGRGVRLSPAEVVDMSMDAAIATTAMIDAERAGWRMDQTGELVRLATESETGL
jgi:hypothetical protein